MVFLNRSIRYKNSKQLLLTTPYRKTQRKNMVKERSTSGHKTDLVKLRSVPSRISVLPQNTTAHFFEFVRRGGGKQLRRAARGCRTLLGLFSSPLSVVLPSNGNHLFFGSDGVYFCAAVKQSGWWVCVAKFSVRCCSDGRRRTARAHCRDHRSHC
jgi:hypothetical protein